MYRKLILSVLLAAAAGAALADNGAPTGRWLTESGNLEIDIAPCGAALCGSVVKVLAERAMSAPPGAAADARPALGMRLLRDLSPAADGAWVGTIYNRQNSTTYDCAIRLDEAAHLTVRIYQGTPQTGKTQYWQRVAAQGAP